MNPEIAIDPLIVNPLICNKGDKFHKITKNIIDFRNIKMNVMPIIANFDVNISTSSAIL